ncbi:hypothetical protein DLS63_13700, partial [Staphylococcus pseudintermedius]
LFFCAIILVTMPPLLFRQIRSDVEVFFQIFRCLNKTNKSLEVLKIFIKGKKILTLTVAYETKRYYSYLRRKGYPSRSFLLTKILYRQVSS